MNKLPPHPAKSEHHSAQMQEWYSRITQIINALVNEANMGTAFTVNFDQYTPTVGYIGEAFPGVPTSAAKWRIKHLDMPVDGDVIITWADGNANFDNVWDNRASLSYS